jgi:hypothetical protein
MGVAEPSHLLKAGGEGWCMSVMELAKFWAELQLGYLVKDAYSLNKIFRSSAGQCFVSRRFTPSTHGVIVSKSGAEGGHKAQIASVGGFQCSFITNHNVSSVVAIQLIEQAFAQAWEKKAL